MKGTRVGQKINNFVVNFWVLLGWTEMSFKSFAAGFFPRGFWASSERGAGVVLPQSGERVLLFSESGFCAKMCFLRAGVVLLFSESGFCAKMCFLRAGSGFCAKMRPPENSGYSGSGFSAKMCLKNIQNSFFYSRIFLKKAKMCLKKHFTSTYVFIT